MSEVQVFSGRVGSWMQTHSGRAFWPLDPRPEEIHIGDIAHGLAHQCRYNGHTLFHYSVAQHSVLVSRAVPEEDARWGLLHDASEAYLSDIPRPLKRHMPDYHRWEEAVMAAVCTRFGLPFEMPASVFEADLRILSNERAALMAPMAVDRAAWGNPAEPIPHLPIEPIAPAEAKQLFLARYAELFGDRG